MYGFIQSKFVTVSTGKLVAVSIVTSIIITSLLTTILSLVTLGKMSLELLVTNSIIGAIVPAIVAPFVINLVKQSASWEQINQDLKQENIDRKRLENEALQKAKGMQAVNELAIECAAASPDEDILKLITGKLLGITNALGVGITIYDSLTRTFTIKNVTVSGQVLSAANQLVGHNLLGMVIPVSPEVEARILTEKVVVFSDLSEISFGVVSKPMALILKNTLSVGNFTGMALAHRGKLIGTAVIAQREGEPTLDLEVCKTLAHVSAVSIERKAVENALRESETKFRAIIENLSEGIQLLDEQGLLIEWNPAQEILTGLKRNEVLGKSVWDVQFQLMLENRRTPENYESTKQRIKNILTTGKYSNFHHPFETVLQPVNSGPKYILQTLFPIHTDTGHRIGSIMKDITIRKQAELDRDRLIMELKSKNTELEQFTYTVSHDLKAPLITIKGFLGLLEKDALDGNIDRMKKDTSRINEAVDKMQQLLNELLELSRIGRIVNPSQEVLFEELVKDAMKSVRGRLEEYHVIPQVEKDLPVVWVDRTRMIQVIQNLLDNAAKFMGDQVDPQITIGMQGRDKDNKYIFYIKDNGIGIEAQQLERVFGLFQKLSVNEDGTGIGLAIVKRIIEVHGGRVWATSDGEGQGTTVFFTLPAP
ncbi:MAG: PAS domain S-box protein [Anaerolineales bacterium]|nr:PAS domain S-box protein [Anaerolineales bacterium]